jgi:hypothetical protein
MLAAKLIPNRTHAFDQSKRPADPKRHTDVIARLKIIGAKRLRIGMRIVFPNAAYYIVSERIVFFSTQLGY